MSEPADDLSCIEAWMRATDDLEPWYRAQTSSSKTVATAAYFETQWHRIREVMQALDRHEVAIPAEVPGDPPRGEGQANDLQAHWKPLGRNSRPAGINEVRLKRDAILRLGVWRVLKALHDRAEATNRAAGPLDDLRRWLGSGRVEVPPGIGPSLPYAGSEAALAFFNGRLRDALRRLGKDHDIQGSNFGALAEVEPFDDSGVAVSRWSGAWTVAVSTVYLDVLSRRSGGDVDLMLRDLWRKDPGTVRFKAPAGLAVLPSRERDMHIDLWTGTVLAQVLSHDPTRWDEAARHRRWHRVRMAMHDLGEKDQSRAGKAGARTLYRGLGVGMIYQAVFIDGASQALQQMRADEPTMSLTPDPGATMPTIVVDMETPCAGQQPNLQLILRWKDGLASESSQRLATTEAQPVLDLPQRQAMAGWLSRRATPTGVALRLDAALIDWRPATADDRFVDEDGGAIVALGHAALWSAVGPEVEWMDLSLTIWADGRWSNLPVHVREDHIDGELRSWLFLNPTESAALPADFVLLRQALASSAQSMWAASPAGLGVFLMGAVDLGSHT